MIKVSNIFYLLIILIIFTSLRNLSFIYYIIVFSILSFFILKIKRPIFKIGQKIPASMGFFVIFFTLTLFAIIWSGIYWGSLDFILAAPRAVLMLVLVVVLLSNIKSEGDFIKILKIILICYLFAALTILFQIYLNEPISWFARKVNRGGMVRYSSILGSLTIFPSVVGYCFLLASSNLLLKSLYLRLLFVIFIILTSLFTLSKAGVAILFLSMIVYSIFYYKSFIPSNFKIKKKLAFLPLFVLILFISLNIDFISNYYNTAITHLLGTNNILSNSDAVILDAPPLSIDIITNRLFLWTSTMIEKYGPIVYFSGIGLQGAGGIFGFKYFPMAHNALGDLFFMGGFFYLSFFLFLYLTVQIFLWKNRRESLAKIFFTLNIIFFINMLYASGSIFQPSISILFWLSLVYVQFINKKSFHKSRLIK